jgi:hypothetical protein
MVSLDIKAYKHFYYCKPRSRLESEWAKRDVTFEIKCINIELLKSGNAYMGSIGDGLADSSEHLFQYSALSSTSEFP